MKISFNFTKEEVYLIARALETETETLLKSGEDEKSYEVNNLKIKFFELYNLKMFEE